MKTTQDIIGLWSKWQTGTDYVCPSRISKYYWDYYDIFKENKPLFPYGEINDIMAVFAGTKPAALADTFYVKYKNGLEEIDAIAKQKGFVYSIDDNHFVIAIHKTILANVMYALNVGSSKLLGLSLGYSVQAVENFLTLRRKTIHLYKNGNTIPFHIDKDNFHTTYAKPSFEIPAEWFEK